MLDACAPGWVGVETTHNLCVRYKGKEYPRLPLGDHGKRARGNIEIEIGHVKHMVRKFEITDCAAAELPQLRLKKKKKQDVTDNDGEKTP